MPNTPATVGAGVSAIAAGSRAGEPDLAWAEELLGAVGHVVRLPEASLDAVTGLSGSGPAYVFLVVEALIAAGQAVGLSPAVSRLLATDTVAGAARLLVESGETPESLRAAVTSPGGTTEAGVRGRGRRPAFGPRRRGGRGHGAIAAICRLTTAGGGGGAVGGLGTGPIRTGPGSPAASRSPRARMGPGGLSSHFLGRSLSNNHHIGVQSPQAGEG